MLQLRGGEGTRRWRVPGLKTGTGRDRSSPRLGISQGVLLMRTLEASAATDGVSLNEAAERLVKGGRLALIELKCARATLSEFGAGRGEVEAICNVVVHCREVSAASLGSTVAARRLVWKVRRVSKRGRWQKLDVLGIAGPVLGGSGVSGAVRGLEGRRVSEATWLPTARQKERLVEAGFGDPRLSGVINPERALKVVDAWRGRLGLTADERVPCEVLEQEIVRPEGLRALTAKGSDGYVLVPDLRRLDADEVACVAFGVGVDSPLFTALGERKGVTRGLAAKAVGRGVAVGVATRVLETCIERGWLPRPGGDRVLTYASGCSGVDFVAEAVRVLYGQGWRYAHASERRSKVRKLLVAAWGGHGLTEERVLSSAADAGGEEEVDLYVFTYDCGGFSRANRRRGDESMADGALGCAEAASFIRAGRASVVVMENSDERAAVRAMTAVLAGLSEYEWYEQRLGASDCARCAQDRVRRFWVGVRRE